MQEIDPVDEHGLTDIVGAWCNGPALASLLLTFVVAALVVPLLAPFFAALVPVSATMIAAALGVAWVALGTSAAASQFAERAAGRPVSGVARAFAAAPRIVLGSLLLVVLLAGAFAIFALIAAAVLVACRLPIVGPVLYAVAVPALTVAGAAFLLVLVAMALLTLPVLWERHSLRTALAQSWAIVARRRQRAFAELITFLLVGAVAAAVLSASMLAVFERITALAAPLAGIVSPPAALASFAAAWSPAGVAALPAAASLGAALVLAIALALLTAIGLSGLVIAYGRAADGMDIAVARAAAARAIVELQVKKSEAIEETGLLLRRMRRRGNGARGTVPPSAPIVSSPPPDGTGITLAAEGSGFACARCAAPAQPGDLYCGNCGQRLSSPLVA